MNQEVVVREEERAKRLMAMGQMAASLAHEIRNPLGSMELYCSLLKQDLKQQPENLELAERIYQGIRTLDRIITNCLQFSRDMNPKRIRIENTTVLFKELENYLRPKAESFGAELRIVEHSHAPLIVDPYLSIQALLNVVQNALDAVEERYHGAPGGEVVIESYVESGTAWTIVVRDNGVGIPKEVQEQIFDPFYSTKERGTGLGLAVVFSVVKAHDGKISIESSEELGTRFTMELSLAE